MLDDRRRFCAEDIRGRERDLLLLLSLPLPSRDPLPDPPLTSARFSLCRDLDLPPLRSSRSPLLPLAVAFSASRPFRALRSEIAVNLLSSSARRRLAAASRRRLYAVPAVPTVPRVDLVWAVSSAAEADARTEEC